MDTESADHVQPTTGVVGGMDGVAVPGFHHGVIVVEALQASGWKKYMTWMEQILETN